MSFFYSILPSDVQHDHEIYELSASIRLIVHEEREADGDVFFTSSLFEHEHEADDFACLGSGTGGTAAAALIDLLLELAAYDARLPKDAAANLDKIAQEATRLVVLYITELPAYEESER